MAAYVFSYLEPDALPDEKGFKKEDFKYAEMMSEAELKTVLVDNYLAKISIEDLKRAEHYEKYKFSLYDMLYKIKPYSYVGIEAWRTFVGLLTQRVGPYTQREWGVHRTFLTKMMGVPSYFFNMESQPYNLFLRMNVIDNNGKYRVDKMEKPTEYKIHLCVKEEYAFYAFLKLGIVFFPEFRKIYPDDYLELKWNLDARMSRLSSEDSELKRRNGGPAATIVIYTRTSTLEVIKFMLRTLIASFPEADAIGFMELTGTLTLPYANVRLNKMLCYAQGDRVNKLQTKRSDSKKKNGERSRKYIPDWIIDIQSKCGTEEANKLSQLYLGIDICTIGEILHDEQCVDDICYLAVDKNVLDPRAIFTKGGRRKKTRRVPKHF